METARRWCAKFHSKEKHKTSSKKTQPRPNGKEGMKAQLNEETPSNATKQKAAAAKQYIEKALQGTDEELSGKERAT
ncbi:non-specific serine/threonine protein kinase [Salvia divinorum]|uniref:Non-specific serine/threonine protein kinase n=1 Tax=Salvia divinorum TaxID=28513 RepID=A0ABD1FWC2_SALDI